MPGLLAIGETERDAYLGYFDHVVAGDGGVPVVVDIGYAGTIQSNLIRLLDRPLHGTYMALNGSTVHEPTAVSPRKARYFDARRGDDPATSPILRNDLLLESLLTAPAPQFSHFRREAGALVPQFVAGTEPRAPGLLEQVHAGVLAFFDDLHRVAGEDALDLAFDPRLVQAPLASLDQGTWQLGPWATELGVDDHFSGRGRVSR